MTKKLITYPTKGLWDVTTEGDVEGRTVNHLGTFEGELDDIAFALADRCYYSLRFKPVNPDPKKIKTDGKKPVSVSLDIESGSWDLHGEPLADYWRNMMAGRDVSVEAGTYFASVVLKPGKDYEREMKKRAEDKAAAIAKLSPYERDLLGLNGVGVK